MGNDCAPICFVNDLKGLLETHRLKVPLFTKIESKGLAQIFYDPFFDHLLCYVDSSDTCSIGKLVDIEIDPLSFQVLDNVVSPLEAPFAVLLCERIDLLAINIKVVPENVNRVILELSRKLDTRE